MIAQNSKPEVILAIDPGYDRAGWAVGASSQIVNKINIKEFGCIRTNSKQTIGSRYKTLANQLTEICEKYSPDILVIEQLYFSNNTTTALKVSEARGVIFATVFPFVQNILEFHPNTLKLAVTGHGQASKAAVEKMVRLQLALPPGKIIDDAIDALALIITYVAHRPGLVKPPNRKSAVKNKATSTKEYSDLQGNQNQVIL